MSTISYTDNEFVKGFRTLPLPTVSGEPAWVGAQRQGAQARFLERGLPTTRDEEWKYTNVAVLGKDNWRIADSTAERRAAARERIKAEALADTIRLVCVDGVFDSALSDLSALPAGCYLGPLAGARNIGNETNQALVAQLGATDGHSFQALNTAFMRDVICLLIPSNVQVNKPIHILSLHSGEDRTAVFPRFVSVVGQSAQVDIIEQHCGLGEGAYLTVPVTEMVVGENAGVGFYRLQLDGSAAHHISALRVRQLRNSRFASHTFSLGGQLVRNDLYCLLDGEGIECTLNGLSIAGGSQHIDNHTAIDHAKPNCTSFETYKGILAGQAHGVFNGKVFVREDAQKTDAKQNNMSILLSPDAVINSKPQLEIFADDVKCTHGATIGHLDENSLFYLRTRGLNEADARRVLVYAFASDVVNQGHCAPLQSRLEYLVNERLDAVTR